jgi:mannose-6-phosphate isomerase-like protein (cupin superfamily)
MDISPQIQAKVLRPYGYYCILTKEPGLKIDQVGIEPKSATKPHRHIYRHEHWYILKGQAKVNINQNSFCLEAGQSIEVPKNTMHNIVNLGEEILTVIKIQTGENLEESDSYID